MFALAPAPACTTTCKPSATRRLVVSGVAATRSSPSLDSLAMKTLAGLARLYTRFGTGNNLRSDQEALQKPMSHRPRAESRVGVDVPGLADVFEVGAPRPRELSGPGGADVCIVRAGHDQALEGQAPERQW